MRRWGQWWAAGRREVPTRRRKIATVVLLFVVVGTIVSGSVLGPVWADRSPGVVYVLLGVLMPWSWHYWDGTNVHERRVMVAGTVAFLTIGITTLAGLSSWWFAPLSLLVAVMVVEDLRGGARRRRDVSRSTTGGSFPGFRTRPADDDRAESPTLPVAERCCSEWPSTSRWSVRSWPCPTPRGWPG